MDSIAWIWELRRKLGPVNHVNTGIFFEKGRDGICTVEMAWFPLMINVGAKHSQTVLVI